MENIKARIHFINTLGTKLKYNYPSVEFLALQTRMVIETIFLASLITNSEKYIETYNKLGSVWNIKYIAKDIEQINPNFFPIPTVSSNKPIDNLTRRNGDFPSKEELIDFHSKCGKFLHSANPYASKIDYKEFEKSIHVLIRKIMQMMSCHTIHLANTDYIFHVVMSGINDHQIQVATLKKIEQ